MTQEEKAKRYNEALEIAKKNYITAQDLREGSQIGVECFKNTLENIFPELKESEDERIRKELVAFVKSRLAGFPECDRFIAWLEKQCKKPQGKTALEAINNINDKGYCCIVKSQDKSALEARTDNELVEEVYSHLDSIKETADRMTSGNFMHNKAAIKFSANTITKVLELIGIKAQKDSKYDNQNCVKPTDEPKFHEGVWLTENHPNNYARFVQILEIVNVQGKKRYRISRDLHNDEDIVECRFIEDNWHHFNIQDAKDGDVLADKYNNIGIFQECEGICWHSYIYLGCDGELRGYNIGGSHEQTDTHPATKEQRELLFQKIKEAGYEWDADKKELNKEEVK